MESIALELKETWSLDTNLKNTENFQIELMNEHYL
jgi:hypothetical protein